jgi:hypothetical protein
MSARAFVLGILLGATCWLVFLAGVLLVCEIW